MPVAARGDFAERAGRAMAGQAPSPEDVHFACGLLFDAAAWAGWTGDALRLLGQDERARAARFRFDHDRTTYVLAHAVWRVLLGRCIGSDAADVPLGFARSGQPCLPGSGWVTSLSHSGTWVLLAAARARALGVDVERAPSPARLDALAPDICTPDEAEELRALPHAVREQALLQIWTRKEALLKAAGLGLALAPSSFAAPAGAAVALPGGVAEAPCAIHDLALPSGLVGAWAAPPAVRELAWWSLGACGSSTG